MQFLIYLFWSRPLSRLLQLATGDSSVLRLLYIKVGAEQRELIFLIDWHFLVAALDWPSQVNSSKRLRLAQDECRVCRNGT